MVCMLKTFWSSQIPDIVSLGLALPWPIPAKDILKQFLKFWSPRRARASAVTWWSLKTPAKWDGSWRGLFYAPLLNRDVFNLFQQWDVECVASHYISQRWGSWEFGCFALLGTHFAVCRGCTGLCFPPQCPHCSLGHIKAGGWIVESDGCGERSARKI